MRFDVRPPRRASCSASTTAAVENATEDIPKTTAARRSSSVSKDVREVEVRFEALPRRCAKPAGKAGASRPKAAAACDHSLEVVVFLAGRGISENLVGLGDGLEAFECLRVIGISVRVVLAGQLAVGALDLLRGCG